jgi:hypothetical protein
VKVSSYAGGTACATTASPAFSEVGQAVPPASPACGRFFHSLLPHHLSRRPETEKLSGIGHLCRRENTPRQDIGVGEDSHFPRSPEMLSRLIASSERGGVWEGRGSIHAMPRPARLVKAQHPRAAEPAHGEDVPRPGAVRGQEHATERPSHLRHRTAVEWSRSYFKYQDSGRSSGRQITSRLRATHVRGAVFASA